MYLDEYLKREKIPVSHAAQILGVHPNHLYMICRKKRWAGYMLAKQIQEWTNGEVTIEDMLKDKPETPTCPTCGRKMHNLPKIDKI